MKTLINVRKHLHFSVEILIRAMLLILNEKKPYISQYKVFLYIFLGLAFSQKLFPNEHLLLHKPQ